MKHTRDFHKEALEDSMYSWQECAASRRRALILRLAIGLGGLSLMGASMAVMARGDTGIGLVTAAVGTTLSIAAANGVRGEFSEYTHAKTELTSIQHHLELIDESQVSPIDDIGE